MQEKIFPTDQLLKTTHYTYLEPKNQKFDIDSQKVYEVSLLEKGDLIKLTGGMKLLVDGVILKGEIKYSKIIKIYIELLIQFVMDGMMLFKHYLVQD
jgi:hypothetical protein